MAVQDIAGLFKVLEKSGLLQAEEFEKVKAEVAAQPNKFDKPEKIARHWVQTGLLTKWQVMQLLSGKAAFFLGKYKLLNLLGVGGMGRVFLAEHTMMNRKVALKVISKEYCKDPEAIKRFQAEARAIAALNHVNIVQAYNFETEGDRYYIVMEYVTGKSLEEIVQKQGPLPIDDVVSYLRQSTRALKHAHDRKMIHCDIKPDNLLLNDRGQIKILDMGIAHLQDSSKNQKTESDPDDSDRKSKDDSAVMGTVDYMAPEMAAGGAEPDPRMDIYSLGCTMFFLLTGQIPYPEGTLMERILAHQDNPPRDPRELRPDTPKELAYIVLKMEEKKPEDRFQSMDEVLTALEAWSPESTELNILENAGLTSSTSNKKPAAWSSSAAKTSADVSARQTESFEFPIPGQGSVSTVSLTTLQSSGSATGEKSSPHVSGSGSGKGKPGSNVKGKKRTVKKAPKEGFLSQMDTKTKIIIGGAIGLVVIIAIVLALVFSGALSGSSSKELSPEEQAQQEKSSQERAAEILKKEREEAEKQDASGNSDANADAAPSDATEDNGGFSSGLHDLPAATPPPKSKK